jgi:hypothetical protein
MEVVVINLENAKIFEVKGYFVEKESTDLILKIFGKVKN